MRRNDPPRRERGGRTWRKEIKKFDRSGLQSLGQDATQRLRDYGGTFIVSLRKREKRRLGSCSLLLFSWRLGDRGWENQVYLFGTCRKMAGGGELYGWRVDRSEMSVR